MCELKSPWRYRRHDIVARTVALLPEDAVVVSFESHALRQVRGLRTLQHVGLGVSIRAAARFAWGVGFWDPRARRRAASRRRGGSACGRPSTRSTTNARMRELVALGVDGIFTDRPELLLGARQSVRSRALPDGKPTPTRVPTGYESARVGRDVGGQLARRRHRRSP